MPSSIGSTSRSLLTASAAVLCAFTVRSAHADTFGTGPNTFTLDFVNIGNAGNTDDTGLGSGLYSSPHGGVAYLYRMGMFEISQEQIDMAAGSGLANVIAGAHAGAKPAADISWYEAAAFVNWLNTSTGHQAAYNLNSTATALTLWPTADAWDNDPGAGADLNLYRHKNAYYFLPSEDEWYKAAYHQNDGVTANYWDYATSSDSVPMAVASGTGNGNAVYDQPFGQGPADVNLAGGLSEYGTMGQNGNVWEWQESDFDGMNSSPSELRTIRGGYWSNTELDLRSETRNEFGTPTGSNEVIGFRVASVPEPSTAVLMLSASFLAFARRRRRDAL